MKIHPIHCPECGQALEGILETVAGLALILIDDGEAEYLGETRIDWNSQRPQRDAAGGVQVQCPDGHVWACDTSTD